MTNRQSAWTPTAPAAEYYRTTPGSTPATEQVAKQVSATRTAPATDLVRPVVVGIDGSDGAHAALLWAADEARLRGVPLQIVHTWPMDPPAAPIPSSGFAVVDKRAQHAEIEVEVEAASVRGGSLVISHLVCEGSAENVLVDASDAADLIVVGSRGRGSVRSLLLGSVSAHVASHAHCPVVVVPHPASPAAS